MTGIAFGLTIFSGAIFLYAENMIPFGENTIAVLDMIGQYTPFLLWYKQNLLKLNSLIYSLSGGLGQNTIGFLAYYLVSPLNFLLLFFKNENIPYGIILVSLLKAALASSTMQLYLFKIRKDWYSIVFGCCYGLCSFAVCHGYNIMWMDTFMLVPIIMIGLEKILRGEKNYLYSISLCLGIVCNYYMGYMVCLYLLLYFLLYLFLRCPKENRLEILIMFVKYSLCAGGMSAFFTLPTLYCLRRSAKTTSSIWDLFSIEKCFEWKYLPQSILCGGYTENVKLGSAIPLIYVGILSAFLVLLYFIEGVYTTYKSKKVDTGKFFEILLLGILLLCTYFRGPYRIWHGMSDPVGNDCRFSYVIAFTLISIAYKEIANLKKEKKQIIVIAGIIFAVLLCGALKNGVELEIVIINVVLIICYLGVYFWEKQNWLRKILLMLMFISELTYNAITAYNINFVSINDIQKYSEYLSIYNPLSEAKLMISNASKDYYNYRIGRTPGVGNGNSCYYVNLNMIDSYTSTSTVVTKEILERMGQDENTFLIKYNMEKSENANILLGIRYLIAKSDENVEGYEKIGMSTEVSVYENQYVFPMSFLVESEDYVERLLETQTDTVIEKVKSNNSALVKIDCKDSEKMSVTYDNSEQNAKYVCFSIPYEKAWDAFVNGKKVVCDRDSIGLLLVPISDGIQSIEIKYNAPFRRMGLVVTIISVVLLVNCNRGKGKKHEKK